MNNIRKLFFIFVILISIFVSGSFILGNTYYVATNGNDTDTGGIGDPFKTIQKAADSMSAGDTCLIRGGIYYEVVLR